MLCLVAPFSLGLGPPTGFAVAAARKSVANGTNSVHGDEEERVERSPERKKKHEGGIFLGQECKIKRRRVRFDSMCKEYDHKGTTILRKVDIPKRTLTRHDRKKPFNCTKDEVDERRAQNKDEEKAALTRSLKLYPEVSGWLRNEASKDHTKLNKWIANKF